MLDQKIELLPHHIIRIRRRNHSRRSQFGRGNRTGAVRRYLCGSHRNLQNPFTTQDANQGVWDSVTLIKPASSWSTILITWRPMKQLTLIALVTVTAYAADPYRP